MLRKLIDIHYTRNDAFLGRGRFRVKGDVIEIQPAYEESAYRVSMFGDEIEEITHFDPLTGEVYGKLEYLNIFPATQYVTSKPTIERAVDDIRHELEEQVRTFESEEPDARGAPDPAADRVRRRDDAVELGFCNGIENYSRILDGRPPGSAPYTLIDYFPSDFVVFIDESHQTVPQIGGMYEGDRSRKQTLVDFGFRLPSALDNRPLRFDEFLAKVPQMVFVSATPGPVRAPALDARRRAARPPDRDRRPRGRAPRDEEPDRRPPERDPPARGAGRADARHDADQEDGRGPDRLPARVGSPARYLHSEIDTLDRIQLIRELRLGEYDVLVGVNLLREGLDLPEVSLIAILDADKEGFLRGKTALIQTIGRAARNTNGKVRHVRGQADRGDQGRARGDRPSPRRSARLQRGARDHAGVDQSRASPTSPSSWRSSRRRCRRAAAAEELRRSTRCRRARSRS